jgi:hypothetical protein
MNTAHFIMCALFEAPGSSQCERRKPLIKRGFCFSLLMVVLVLAVGGCERGSEAEKNEALSAVRNYNSMLQMAYLQANIGLMTSFATEKQVKMLFPTIQALQSTGNSMRTEQTAFQVKRISVTGDRAVVSTVETWVYWWQSVETGVITKPKETITYKLKFNLIKKAGKWKVDSLEEA